MIEQNETQDSELMLSRSWSIRPSAERQRWDTSVVTLHWMKFTFKRGPGMLRVSRYGVTGKRTNVTLREAPGWLLILTGK